VVAAEAKQEFAYGDKSLVTMMVGSRPSGTVGDSVVDSEDLVERCLQRTGRPLLSRAVNADVAGSVDTKPSQSPGARP